MGSLRYGDPLFGCGCIGDDVPNKLFSQDGDPVMLYALSPATIAKRPLVELYDGSSVRLAMNSRVTVKSMAGLVLNNVKDCSYMERVPMGTTVTLQPGWLYMFQYMGPSLSFSVESLRVDSCMYSACASAVISRVLGAREPDRMGLTGVLFSALLAFAV